jgi:predicted  nucleic acid-binding Zn-ribbon protein
LQVLFLLYSHPIFKLEGGFLLKNFTALLTALALASAIPVELASAASIEITTTIQASLDKTIAGATQTQANKISSLYSEFLTLQKQEQDWDAKINTLHSKNKDTSAELGNQAKEIDSAKLAKLEEEITQTRARHQPLLSQYTALNKQIEAARLLNSKSLNAMLRIQAAAMRIPVQLARFDISAKVKASQAAKDKASKATKKIRSSLNDMDPINVQIKAKQGAIKTIQNSLSPIWSAFKQGAKKEDTSAVQGSLTSMISLSRQMNAEKESIFKLEMKISDALAGIKAQMP